MKRDPLNQFVALRQALVSRQSDLRTELSRLNEALGVVAAAPPAKASAAGLEADGLVSPVRRGRRPGGRRPRNELSLREAVLTVTRAKPLAKAEILEAVAQLGYQFSAKSPLNSLNTLLYTDKQIKNYGGKFGPG